MADGLYASNDVCGNANPNSSYFIRKDEPIIIDTLIANDIITETIDLNGGVLTTTGGTILTLNGNPVGGGQVNTITGTAPITVTGTAIDPVISLANSGVVPATYTVASVTVDAKGLITNASSGVIPPNDDWSNFPAQTNVNMNNFKLTSLATPTANTDGTTKLYVDTLDGANVKITGNQTVGGIKTFTALPESSVVPTTANQLVNKNYVDTLPAPATPTLTQVLTAGNSAGTSQINMNSNKIINCLNPTNPQDVATKNYVDTLPAPATPTLGQVLTAGNTASGDINMNGFDISAVNDITMSGLLPSITATNVAGNLTLSALGSFNAVTGGLMTLASGGILSLGGATHTSLENLRIDNSLVSKEPSTADLQFSNVQSVANTAGTITLGATTNGDITTSMAGTGAVALLQNAVGGGGNPLLKLETNASGAVGVAMEMYHNKNGVVGDRTGVITFAGKDTAGTKVTYSRIRGDILDPTTGSIDGELHFDVQKNSTLTNILRVNGTGTRPTAIIDGTNSTGSAGQVLSSTGTGLQWVTSGGGGYAGTTETITVPGATLSSLIENSQIDVVGDFTLAPGVTPNQRKIVTVMSGLPKSMREFFSGYTGSVVTGTISCAVYDPILQVCYFGGTFVNTPDGVVRQRIASYSPVTGLFYSLGTGTGGLVTSLFLDNTIQRLYVGGGFVNAGGVTGATRFARYDITGVGTGNWGTLSSNFPSNGQVNAIVRNTAGTEFFIGGTFSTFNTVVTNSFYMARYTVATGTYTSVGTGINTTTPLSGGTAGVNALLFDNNRVYIGGNFTGSVSLGADTANICYWNTVTNLYVPMGRGTRLEQVNSIVKFDNEIVIGGSITSITPTTGADIIVNRVASWNPTTLNWKALGNSLANTVSSLYVSNEGVLYAMGTMTQLINAQEGTDMQRIARWDAVAQKWRTFGGINGQVNGMLEIGSEYLIFGNFNRTFYFEAYGQNHNMAVITPANFIRLFGSQITNNGYPVDYYQISGQDTANQLEFTWNASEGIWLNTRDNSAMTNC